MESFCNDFVWQTRVVSIRVAQLASTHMSALGCGVASSCFSFSQVQGMATWTHLVLWTFFETVGPVYSLQTHLFSPRANERQVSPQGLLIHRGLISC